MKIRILRKKGLGNGSTKAIQSLSKHDIEIIRNDGVIPVDTELLIRWGCTSKIPAKRTLNKADSITKIGNKYQSRKLLQENGISIPALYEEVTDDIKYPVIVRPHYHSQGKQLWKCDDKDSLTSRLLELTKKGIKYYISEYVEKDAEYGVFIFNNRVTSVVSKNEKIEGGNKNVAWNVAQGTHQFENVKWSNWDISVCKLALKAVVPFDIIFCRVDIIVKDNVPYVLELNSAHSLTSPYRQEIFTKCLDYLIDNGAVQNELDLNKEISYKTIIHPALRENKMKNNV